MYFFCEGPESNCFRLFGSHGLCHGPLAVPLWGESGPRYCAEEWAGQCSRRTLFMKIGGQPSPQAALTWKAVPTRDQPSTLTAKWSMEVC